MKKNLEAELLSIAHKILQLKDKSDIEELKAITAKLYEKILVLSYVDEHFKETAPTLGKSGYEEVIKEDFAHQKARPDGTEYNESAEELIEPNTEKIKDIVAQMDPETTQVDELFKEITETDTPKEEDFGVHYDKLPTFEPVSNKEKSTPEPKDAGEIEENNEPEENLFTPKTTNQNLGGQKQSLNDRLKKGINIGLNDRLAYIKHLFDGNTDDYNRVLSQLNTASSFEKAKTFIETMIKPDYNNWEGKEEWENKFLQTIENKFN